MTKELRIPTIGIGAGPDCDAQVLVWQDMAGLRGGTPPRFVKRYADLRTTLSRRGPGLRRRRRGRHVPGGRALIRVLSRVAARSHGCQVTSAVVTVAV